MREIDEMWDKIILNFYIFFIPEILNKDCYLHLYHRENYYCIERTIIYPFILKKKKQIRRAESKRDVNDDKSI